MNEMDGREVYASKWIGSYEYRSTRPCGDFSNGTNFTYIIIEIASFCTKGGQDLATVSLRFDKLDCTSKSRTLPIPQFWPFLSFPSPSARTNLNDVGRSRHVAATAGPVDVDVLTLRVLGIGKLGLDAEGVGTEVVSLGLEQVGGQVLGAVSVEPRQRGREGRGRDTQESRLGDDVTPAGLGLVDGLVEEVVEEQVLQVGVLAVGSGDVLEEDGADDAATTPHEGDGRLVELPAVLFGGLCISLVSASRQV